MGFAWMSEKQKVKDKASCTHAAHESVLLVRVQHRCNFAFLFTFMIQKAIWFPTLSCRIREELDVVAT